MAQEAGRAEAGGQCGRTIYQAFSEDQMKLACRGNDEQIELPLLSMHILKSY